MPRTHTSYPRLPCITKPILTAPGSSVRIGSLPKTKVAAPSHALVVQFPARE